MNISSAENMIISARDTEVFFDRENFQVEYKSEKYKVEAISYKSFDSFLTPYKKFLNINLPTEYTILRFLVYNQINQELPFLNEKLSSLI
jgi:hypothetical protein